MSCFSGMLLWVSALVFLGPLVASGHLFDSSEDGQPFNPWQPFYNLSGCHHGDDLPGLADVKKYLNHFGYLPDVPSNFSGDFDDELEAAILAYQRHFHLNATGALDSTTIDLMVQPRCGVADVDSNSSTATARGRGLYTYFSGRPTWPPYQTHLTYTFTSTSGASASTSAIRSVFTRAFSRWSAATTLTFSESDTSSDADITIGFYSGDHGDGEPFDGVLGTLAHAFSPPDGRFHLDAAENWVAEGDVATAGQSAVDLESVAVHEIGHLLGLGHSTVREAIMYPTIRAGTRKVDLTQDDVDGIQSLYGSNPSYTGVASSPRASATDTMRESDTNGGGAPAMGPAAWALAVAGVVVAVSAPLLAW